VFAAHLRVALARRRCRDGACREALSHLSQALPVFRSSRWTFHLLEVGDVLAASLTGLGRFREASSLLGTLDSERARARLPRLPRDRDLYERTWSAIVAGLGEGASALRAEGGLRDLDRVLHRLLEPFAPVG